MAISFVPNVPATPFSPPKRLFTADELLLFPREWRYELLEGKLIPMTPPGGPHGFYTADLTIEMGQFIRQNGLGYCFAAETGFLLNRNPDTVLAPDFAFVAKERLTLPFARGYVPLAPELVLETRSPSDYAPGVESKMAEWLAAGVRIALDLDPTHRHLAVYHPNFTPVMLTPADTLEGYDVLPGFALPLSRLFLDAS